MSSFLRLSHKPLGSANSSAPNDDDTKLRAIQPAYGVRATWNTVGYYGFEASYLRSKAHISSKLLPDSATTVTATKEETGDVWVNQIFLNGICYFMPNGERFRPYVTAGGQVQFYGTPPLADWPLGSAKTFGFNFGGGLKVQLAKHVLVRIDIRDIYGGSPYDLQYANDSSGGLRTPGWYRQLEGSFGIGIRF